MKSDVPKRAAGNPLCLNLLTHVLRKVNKDGGVWVGVIGNQWFYMVFGTFLRAFLGNMFCIFLGFLKQKPILTKLGVAFLVIFGHFGPYHLRPSKGIIFYFLTSSVIKLFWVGFYREFEWYNICF